MGDAEDVAARWREGVERAASRAYQAAHGSPIPSEGRGFRWRLDRRLAISLGLVVAVIVAVVAAFANASSSPALLAVSAAPAEQTRLIVHVAGSVHAPGLIEVNPGARVGEAIDAAGGATATAALHDVNLARPVRDGEQIYVPAIGESGDGTVNVNRAGASELETLPGIGPVLAARIVAERDRAGPFGSLEDLSRVAGVGPALIADLVDLATV